MASSAPYAVTHERHVPLIVVGGGLAGTCAAIAAARQGVTVALIQERPVLGGNSSGEIRVNPVGASTSGYLRDARETGIMEEIFLETRARAHGLRQLNGQHYPMWDVILSEKAEAEPLLTLLLNTRVFGVETAADDQDGYTNRVTALLAAQQGTEQIFRLTCDAVIDTTGDGYIALQAGAPFRYGREPRAEFGESWAPVEADDLVLGSTIMFAARDVGRPAPFVPPAWAHHFPDEASLPFRNHDQFDHGYWWIEWGGRLDTITDNETIRRELHAAVFGVWDHIKNHCTAPGVRERAATWTLDWIGHLPGKRESRRFEGDHILIEGDVLGGLAAVPDDVVTYGGWPIDLHPPDGIYSSERPCTQPPLPGLYGIRLRCLYSRTVANLFLAGRDISQSHVAHGSTRVMKTCAVIGEASGTAAAQALKRKLTPRALAGDRDAVRDLQQMLLRNGAYLPGVCNRDERDLARRPDVSVSATSQANLALDDANAGDHGWERAGLSIVGHRGMDRQHQSPNRHDLVPLATPVGQAMVLSTGTLDEVTLRLESSAETPVTAHLHVRQADHLRDFGSLDSDGRDVARIEAVVPPGTSNVTFRPARPLTVKPGHPVVLVLEATAGLSSALSAEEPPGTQAGRWDTELGYWRWLHGTLWFTVSLGSTPYGPENVVSGVTRPERGANLWISHPAEPLPQSLELAWLSPVTIGSVEVTFDSQLSGWVWEGAFPLIARDYAIDVRTEAGGSWESVVAVSGNYQRRRVHQIAPRQVTALRVTVAATNGGRTARIVEIRVYPPDA